MAYAAALGETTPRFLDARQAGGPAAHPLFPVAYEWPLALALHARLAPDALQRRSVHAAHDLTIHRPPRAGETLLTRARVVALASRRPGAFLVVRYETVDAAGRPVTTTLYGSIYRGVTLTGPDRVEVPWPAQALPAEELPPLATIAVAANLAHVYTECARIWNPIHTDTAVAEAAGLPGIILHGTATLALAVSRLLAAGNDDPARVRRERGGLPGRRSARRHRRRPVAGRLGEDPTPGSRGRARIRPAGRDAHPRGRRRTRRLRDPAHALQSAIGGAEALGGPAGGRSARAFPGRRGRARGDHRDADPVRVARPRRRRRWHLLRRPGREPFRLHGGGVREVRRALRPAGPRVARGAVWADDHPLPRRSTHVDAAGPAARSRVELGRPRDPARARRRQGVRGGRRAGRSRPVEDARRRRARAGERGDPRRGRPDGGARAA